MKTKELRQKTDKELQGLIDSARTDIAKAHVELRASRQANVKQIRNLKRQLARALTLTRERAITASLQVQTEAKPVEKKS